jgi:hypothetical protein
VPSFRQIWWIEYGSGHVYVFTPQLAELTAQGWRGGWSRYTFTHLAEVVSLISIVVNDVTLDGSVSYPLLGVRTAGTVGSIHAFTGRSTADNSVAFTASVKSAPFLLGDGTVRVSCDAPILEAAVQSGATPTVAYVLDHGRETRSGTTEALTAAGSETRRAVRAEAVEAADALAVQVSVTWDSDQSNVIDAVSVPFRTQEAA